MIARLPALAWAQAEHSIANKMAQLIVRQIEAKVVKQLKARAGSHGVSMEEEHRRILRQALLGKEATRPSIKDYLLSMPDFESDRVFDRAQGRRRKVEL
jgi:antitoxin FitA